MVRGSSPEKVARSRLNSDSLFVGCDGLALSQWFVWHSDLIARAVDLMPPLVFGMILPGIEYSE
jgi:hypothetical protein